MLPIGMQQKRSLVNYLGFVCGVGTSESQIVVAEGDVQIWILLAKYPQRPLLSFLLAGRSASGFHPQIGLRALRCPLALSQWLPFKGLALQIIPLLISSPRVGFRPA